MTERAGTTESVTKSAGTTAIKLREPALVPSNAAMPVGRSHISPTLLTVLHHSPHHYILVLQDLVVFPTQPNGLWTFESSDQSDEET